MSEFIRGPWIQCEEMPDVVIDADGYVVAEHVSQSDQGLVIAAPDLLVALQACSKELRAMIDFHNVQNSDDGSYAYDYQTVFEADQAIAKALTPQS